MIDTLADTGSVLELRRDFGPGMVTALVRIEGRPVGVIANNPTHLAGAIDADGADKAARFMQLCDAFDLPILFLCDTPGIMVGPEAEKTALVRHCSRMFVTGASLTVPFFTIVLRKGYGLGAQAMAGGSFKAPLFTVAWPTGEFGGMGLEGAVQARATATSWPPSTIPTSAGPLFDEMVARMYEHGKALNAASLLRDRRRDRPGRLAALDHQRGPLGPAPPRRPTASAGRASTPGEHVHHPLRHQRARCPAGRQGPHRHGGRAHHRRLPGRGRAGPAGRGRRRLPGRRPGRRRPHRRAGPTCTSSPSA